MRGRIMTILTFTPTFTQGLVLGQLSILVLLAFVLRYLFFDTSIPSIDETKDGHPDSTTSVPQSSRGPTPSSIPASLSTPDTSAFLKQPHESVEWFNFLLVHVTQAYRADWHGGMSGSAGNEAARVRVERWMQQTLSSTFMAPVKVHSVSLGTSSPRVSNARVVRSEKDLNKKLIEFDMTYKDSISLTLSTSLLFNYPTTSFARLPISLSLSLSLFSAIVTLAPPSPSNPFFTLSLHPSFTLSLSQSSLMGSRAKLADVPKVHQMIEDRIRSALLSKMEVFQIMLPRIGEHSSHPGLEKREVDVFVEAIS